MNKADLKGLLLQDTTNLLKGGAPLHVGESRYIDLIAFDLRVIAHDTNLVKVKQLGPMFTYTYKGAVVGYNELQDLIKDLGASLYGRELDLYLKKLF